MGTQNKFIKGNYFYKKDTEDCYESISEVLVNELCLYIKNLPTVLDYFLFNEEGVCYSKLYTSKTVSDISLYRLIERSEYSHTLDVVYEVPSAIYYNAIIMATSELTDINGDCVRDYFEKIILLDYITRNTDRHLNNILLLYDSESGKYSFGPIMDNGRGLLSDTINFPMGMDIDRAYRMCSSRCKPFNENFDSQLSLIEGTLLYIDYKGFVSRINEILSDIDYYIPFKKRYFRRAVDFLLYSLKESEGKAWCGTI